MDVRTTGSTLLLPLSGMSGLPLDQVNFVACQFLAFIAACLLRLYWHPSQTSPWVRHVIAASLGTFLIIFCFGWYATHCFVQVLLCYAVLTFASVGNIHKFIFVLSMGYLMLIQVSRIYVFGYGLFSTDFSGPLMLMTQKVTSLAFQIHDGLAKEEADLTVDQQRFAMRARPSFLEFLSYTLNFMSILAGPCTCYKDYIAFIEGRNFWIKETKFDGKCLPGRIEPSPLPVVWKKLLIVASCSVLFVTLSKTFPAARNADAEFIASASLSTRLCYLLVSVQAVRPKYYFAWTLADAINNAAGFGFNGYDENGRSRWDLISNLNIWKIETATDIKSIVNNWNIQTSLWLKRVCYTRVPVYPTAATFALSAAWHGVYPGYYMTFSCGVLFIHASRRARHFFRQLHLGWTPPQLSRVIVSWLVTQFTVAYVVLPFLLLAVEPSLRFYSSLNFFLHIMVVLTLLLLPRTFGHIGSTHSQLPVTKATILGKHKDSVTGPSPVDTRPCPIHNDDELCTHSNQDVEHVSHHVLYAAPAARGRSFTTTSPAYCVAGVEQVSTLATQ
uniref:Membrane bound O-acyltransferase domain containing 1 n=1 Tax=Eptatretus burgeri TaxID=7764 RepID=A0A8C4PX26_EPTBU